MAKQELTVERLEQIFRGRVPAMGNLAWLFRYGRFSLPEGKAFLGIMGADAAAGKCFDCQQTGPIKALVLGYPKLPRIAAFCRGCATVRGLCW